MTEKLLTGTLSLNTTNQPYFVKSYIIIPILGLKLGKNESRTFLSKKFFYKTRKPIFSVMNYVLPSCIMPQFHMSNSSCSLIRSSATLQNEGTFICVGIELSDRIDQIIV